MILGIAIAAAAGIAAGWLIGRRRVAAERRALDAHWGERVRMVERGRDRQRTTAEENQARLDRIRAEHRRCESRIKRMRAELRNVRKAHAGCDARAAELGAALEQATARLSGADYEKARALADLEAELGDARRRLDRVTARFDSSEATAERLRAELSEADALHADCGEKIRNLEHRVAELDAMRDRRFSDAKRQRYRRRGIRLVH